MVQLGIFLGGFGGVAPLGAHSVYPFCLNSIDKKIGKKMQNVQTRDRNKRKRCLLVTRYRSGRGSG